MRRRYPAEPPQTRRPPEGADRTLLTSGLSSEFDAAIRRRGADYFGSGRVKIESGFALGVVATVRGGGRYTVELERDGPQIVASCTCPYFEDHACKYLWAVAIVGAASSLIRNLAKVDLQLLLS